MTFTEAAAQVLRLVGKPLHYKEITDVAIEKNLLSHVGKSPEVTMGARLAALVKKGDKDNPLVRIKPGVFALREWDKATVDQGLADRTPALERLREAAESESAEAAEEPVQASAAYPELDEEEQAPDAEELERAKMAARATELFASEADDDVPIFGASATAQSDEEEDEDLSALEREGGSRRRRRRRRRSGRGSEETRGGDGLPSYTVSDAPAETGEVLDTERRERGGAPLEDLAGQRLADAVASLLGGFDRNTGSVTLQRLTEAASRRGRLSGDSQQAQAFIVAALRADNLRRAASGARPRFRIASGRVALTDWLLDGELARLEREIMVLADRYREAARRVLLRRLQELSSRAVGELAVLLLERIGLGDLQTVKRPGTHGSELHLTGVYRGPVGEVRTAVVVRRDGREIGRERVTELRGALHHYGPAQAGWLVTTGQVLSGAREEAAALGAAPCTLIDGLTLARLCDEHGVAILHTQVTLPVPDVEWLDTLRG